MFPKARNADQYTQALGAQMASRKEDLKADAGMPDDDLRTPALAKRANGNKRASNTARLLFLPASMRTSTDPST
jgi:hypothetical protein